MTHLNSEQIRTRLPHRPPLLLVQGLEVAIPGASGVGRMVLEPHRRLWGDWCVSDLFQELVLEGAAQTFGLVLASGPAGPSSAGSAAPAGRHLLLGFGAVTFTATVAPGPELMIAVTLMQRVGGMCRGRFSARDTRGEVAHGELTVMQG